MRVGGTEDITSLTAPTMKLINDAMMQTVRPIWEMAQHAFGVNHPWLSTLLHWAFRRKLAKLEQRHLRGIQSPENFAKYKSYRFLVYERV